MFHGTSGFPEWKITDDLRRIDPTTSNDNDRGQRDLIRSAREQKGLKYYFQFKKRKTLRWNVLLLIRIISIPGKGRCQGSVRWHDLLFCTRWCIGFFCKTFVCYIPPPLPQRTIWAVTTSAVTEVEEKREGESVSVRVSRERDEVGGNEEESSKGFLKANPSAPPALLKLPSARLMSDPRTTVSFETIRKL